MTKGNGTTMHVNSFWIDIKELGVSKTNSCKGLVEFEIVYVLYGHILSLEESGNCLCWGNTEIDWSNFGIFVANNSS